MLGLMLNVRTRRSRFGKHSDAHTKHSSYIVNTIELLHTCDWYPFRELTITVVDTAVYRLCGAIPWRHKANRNHHYRYTWYPVRTTLPQ